MRGTPEAEASRWFRQSELDLEDADFNRSGGRYHLAYFLAQQSAEKALKAYLCSIGVKVIGFVRQHWGGFDPWAPFRPLEVGRVASQA